MNDFKNIDLVEKTGSLFFLNTWYGVGMKRYEYPIFYFCKRQRNFLLLLIALHIVKPVGLSSIINPLTDNIDGKIQYIKTWPWLNKIINYITCTLITKEGIECMGRLENAGIINVTRT